MPSIDARSFANRYFSLWPSEREAVLAAHRKEGEDLARETGLDVFELAREFDSIAAATPNDLIGNIPQSMLRLAGTKPLAFGRLLGWVQTEAKSWDGVLGSALRPSPRVPIFTDSEIEKLAGASDEKLRSFPPVAIEETWGPNKDPSTDKHPLTYDAAVLGFESVRRDDMPVAVRKLFNDLEKTIVESGERQTSSVASVRKAYHKFAPAFYEWYSVKPEAQKPQRTSPRPFQSRDIPALPIMTNGPMQAALESMIVDDKKKAWRNLSTPQPPYFGNPNKTYVTVGDPREMLTPAQQKASADTVLSLDDEHAQTFAFLMAHWMVQNEGQDVPQRARVHVNDLLDFRELERKKRDFRPEQKREERDRILRLSQMWIVVREMVTPRGKKRATKAVDVYSQLIELAIETDATGVGAPIPLLTEGAPPTSVPYAFRYEPGEWVSSYWGNSQYVGVVFRKVLSYDTRILAQRMAMRIALYLSFVPIRTERTVRDLLLGAHIPVPEVQPKRSRDAFDDALGRLRDDGIISDYSYVGDWPADTGKGWSQVWLATKILIHPRRETIALEAAGAVPI